MLRRRRATVGSSAQNPQNTSMSRPIPSSALGWVNAVRIWSRPLRVAPSSNTASSSPLLEPNRRYTVSRDTSASRATAGTLTSAYRWLVASRFRVASMMVARVCSMAALRVPRLYVRGDTVLRSDWTAVYSA
jgi:hypothetical protein